MRLRSASKPTEEEKPVTKTTKSKSPAAKKTTPKKESKIVDSSKKIQKKPKETAKAAPAKKDATKKKEKKEPAPKPEPKGCGGCPEYTPEQQKLFEEKWEELSKLTFVEIKEVIRKFDQPTGGPKTELTDRAADIFVLGTIGNCPHCKQGSPRFDVGSATYYCPGWAADHWFIACKRTLSFESIKRTPLTADQMK